MTLAELDKKYLLTPKLIYFSVGSVYYAFYIFRVQFCADYYGFKADIAGDFNGIISLTGFLFMAFWSWLADRLHRHRSILILLGLLASGSFELLLWHSQDNTKNYWYAMGVFAVFGAVLGGLLPLADYQILKLLSVKFQASRSLYGRQRMMGTVAYGLITLLMGRLIDRAGATVLFKVFPVFSLILMALLLAFGFPDNKPALEEKEAKIAVKKPSGFVFIKDLQFVFFLFVVFVTGCGRQVLQIYLQPHLKQYMNMDNTQAGWAVASSTVFSIVFMFIGESLLKFLGVYLMLVLSMFIMGIRLGLYTFVQPNNSPYIIYAIELLNGIAFSFTHLAGVKVAGDFAPPGLEATAQAIYTSSYMQLPAVLISFAGGRLLLALGGGVGFFGLASKIVLGCAVVVSIKYLLEGKLRPRGLMAR